MEAAATPSRSDVRRNGGWNSCKNYCNICNIVKNHCGGRYGKYYYILKNKNIEIPENTNEIINVFFGVLVSESINYWSDRSSDYIDNTESAESFERKDSDIAKMDKNYRESFSKLNEKTKGLLKNLLKESIEGVLFSIFLKMDQTNFGEWKISIKSKNGEELGIVNNDTELHEDLYNWINLMN